MSGTADRLRAVKEKLAAWRSSRKASAGEQALRRSEAAAQHRKHASFDEGRRDSGIGGGGI